MEYSFDTLVREFLKDDEKKAFDVICKGFGVGSLDELSEKFGAIISKRNSQSNIVDDLTDKSFLQLLDQMKPDVKLFASHAQLPISKTFEKIINIIVVKASYENFGLEATLQLLEKSEVEFTKALAIEGDPNPRLITISEALKERLIELDRLQKLYDWPYTQGQLNALAEYLFKIKYIASEEQFKGCFRKEIPNFEEQIIWKSHATNLVYLSYKLWYLKFPADFHKLAASRFRKENAPFNPNNLKTQFDQIKYECENDDVTKNRRSFREKLIAILRK